MSRVGLPHDGRLLNSCAYVLAVATWPSMTTFSMVPTGQYGRHTVRLVMKLDKSVIIALNCDSVAPLS